MVVQAKKRSGVQKRSLQSVDSVMQVSRQLLYTLYTLNISKTMKSIQFLMGQVSPQTPTHQHPHPQHATRNMHKKQPEESRRVDLEEQKQQWPRQEQQWASQHLGQALPCDLGLCAHGL